MIETLVVLAKQPVPGRVKTRLCPPFTPDQAAALADAALRDTLDAADAAAVRRRVLAFDGNSNAWLRPGWRLAAQCGGTLDRRIATALTQGGAGSVLVGMDTPQLQAHHLARVDLAAYDACLGLSADGGYWVLGLAEHRLAHRVVGGVPMSTAHTGASQLARLYSLGLRVQLLGELIDVDTAAAAQSVAAAAPSTRFATLHGIFVRSFDERVA
jgi:uncharacterized protein